MNELTALASSVAPDASDGFTSAEFMRLTEAGAFDFCGKVELIDGMIIKMAPAGMAHATSNFSVAQRLASAYPQHRIAIDLAIETDDRTLLGIDIAVVNETAPATGPVLGSHVDLAVEIASTTLVKDLAFKAERYAAVGILHYWVVDTEARVVHVMTDPKGGGYGKRRIVRFGEALNAPGTDVEIIID